MPTALQLPAEAHDTDLRPTGARGLDPAFAGRLASTPVAHVPAVSVSRTPCLLPELSKSLPTALQLPVEGHDTELRMTSGFGEAFVGGLASTPFAHDTANAALGCRAIDDGSTS